MYATMRVFVLVVSVSMFRYCVAESSDAPIIARQAELTVGFMDRQGRVVIEPRFDDAEVFSEGLAWVKQDGKFGYIDHSGKVVIRSRFREARSFSEGFAAVSIDGEGGQVRWGFIDRSGEFAIAPRFIFAEPISEGLALVKLDERRDGERIEGWGYIDSSGAVAIKLPVGWGGDDFCEGFARVGYGEKAGFIDRKGQVRVPIEFRRAHRFSEGMASVEDMRGRWGFVGSDGRVVMEPRFDSASGFSEGMALIGQDGKSGFVDREGKIVIAPQFDAAGSFEGGTAFVRKGEQGMLIDKEGRVRLTVDRRYSLLGYTTKQDTLLLFREGLAKVREQKKNGMLGFIDRQGKIVIPANHPELSHFGEGLVAFFVRAEEDDQQ